MSKHSGLGWLATAMLLAGLAGSGLLWQAHVADSSDSASLPSASLALDSPPLTNSPKRYDQPDLALRYFLEQRVGEGESIDPQRWLEAKAAADQLPLYSSRLDAEIDGDGRAAAAPWTDLGPGNVGGRTRVLKFRPGTPSTIYAGGVAGGLWRSTDSGASWTPIGDLLPNIAINSMAIDPGNPDRMFIGTGEGFFNFDAVRGAGIFASTDGGNSWTQLPATANSNFHYVNDLEMSANDSNVLYAATRTGLWRTTDGGASWALQAGVDGATVNGCTDIAIRPGVSPDTVLVACGNFAPGTVYRNTNANGAGTWNSVLALRNQGATGRNQGRVTLAFAPSDNAYVYALIACTATNGACGVFNDGVLAVYRSTNGGAGWNQRFFNSNLNGTGTIVSDLLLTNPIAFCQGQSGFNQGWYDNIIAVDPVDREKIYTGGIDIFRSDNGGTQFGVISYWWAEGLAIQYAHADHHAIVFHPDYNGTTESRMYLGNDGGVFVASGGNSVAAGFAASNVCISNLANTRGPSWISLNNGYGVTQFYHGLPYPGGTTYFGGTQDNGTNRGSDGGGINAWNEIFGGDGGYVAVDPGNTNTLYVETTGISIQKSIDGGANFASSITGINPTQASCGQFINPFIMDPNNANRLWTSNNRLWRTDNAAGNWSQASAILSGTACPAGSVVQNERFSAYAVAPGDSNLLVAGTSRGRICRLTNATASTGATALANCTSPVGIANISQISFDPTTTGVQNTRVVYATVSAFGVQQLLKSTNGGQSWTPLTNRAFGGLPDVPAHTVVADPNYPDGANGSRRLYVGTDIGVFVTIDGGTSWMRENTGFANTVVENLVLQNNGGSRELFAFTHGRSVFKTSLRAAAIYCSTGPLVIPDNQPAGVSQTINVNQVAAQVTDLNLTVDIDHSFVGDLQFSLTHVGSATTVSVLDRPGVAATTNGCGGDDIEALFDDDADVPAEGVCAGATPTIEGRFRPASPFAAFHGLSIGGSWRLNISDLAGGDVGQVNQWCVIATSNSDASVPVLLSALRSQAQGSGARIEFETASNLGSVAFAVVDAGGVELARIASAGDSARAQSYSLEVPLGAGEAFTLHSIEADGRRLPLGRYTIGQQTGATATADEVGFDWSAVAQQEMQRAGARERTRASAVGAEAWLMVDRDGPQRVDFEDLVAIGLDDFAGVPVNQLQLQRRGQPVAMHIASSDASFGPGDALLFIGQANDGLYSREAAYRLSLGQASPSLPLQVLADPTAAATATHRRSRRLAEDRLYSFSSPVGDPWAWRRVVSAGTPQNSSVELPLDDLDGSGQVQLRVLLWGGLDAPGEGNDHHAILELNGQPIADRRFDGLSAEQVELSLSASDFVAGVNTLTILLPGDTGFDADVVYLESVELSYLARIQAEDGIAAWRSDESGVSGVELFGDGFEADASPPCADCPRFRIAGSTGEAWLLRASGPQLGAQRLSGLGDPQVLAIATQAGDRLWLLAPTAWAQPRVRAPVDGSDLLVGPVDYLVISHPSFAAQLQPLLAVRTQQGRAVKLVQTEQLYDAYGDGDFGAEAIAAYLATLGASQPLADVLLVGADSYDYRGNLASPSISFLPTRYVRTDPIVRFAPSDGALVDGAGDGLPDLAIGRLPVRTPGELDAVLAKILGYPQLANRSSLLVADRSGVGATDFASASDGIAAAMNGWNAQAAYLDLATPVQIRAQIRSAVEQGYGLVQYFGHSSPNRWSFENILSSSDLAAGLLQGTTLPTAVWQWGCWNTYHVDPQAGSMGHAWMNADTGAAVVIGAATLTDAAHDWVLGEHLAAVVAEQPGIAHGRALQLAKQRLAVEHPDWFDVLLGVTLLGDPAMATP